MAVWYPNATVNEAVKNGGSFVAGVPFRGVLHTTEGRSFHPQPDSYGGWHTAYPHFTIIEEADGVTVYQHLPVDVAARALKNLRGGVQTNRARAIQIEIVGRAAESPRFSEQMLAALAEWMRWVEAETGVHPHAPREFVGWAGGSGVEASSRMSANEWLAFDGWCGHQHVPENDHWDPGRIKIDRLLSDAASTTVEVESSEGTQAVYQVINVYADDVLNIRAAPGLDADVVGRLAHDAGGLGTTGERRVIGRSNWMTITVGGELEGWVNARYVTPGGRRPLFRLQDVDADETLNVRSEPGLGNPVVTKLAPSQRDIRRTGRAQVVDEAIWCQIEDPVKGWVHSGYLRDQDAAPTVRSRGTEDPYTDEYTHGDVERDSVYE